MDEVEQEPIHQWTLIGLDPPQGKGRATGARQPLTARVPAVALPRRNTKESVTAIAAHLGVGRSTLYRTQGAHDKAIAGHEPDSTPPPSNPPRETNHARTRPTGDVNRSGFGRDSIP